uniref:Putative secreted protein n=1 Tax=Anopheles darlingi TaxID=43151 RepID=A0A2M4DPT1_ANODA
MRTNAVRSPARFSSPNTFAFVWFEILALPSSSCARTPLCAVMRSLLSRIEWPGWLGTSYTCLVLPSISSLPTLMPPTSVIAFAAML